MKIAIFTDTFSPQINGVTKTLDRLLEYFEQKGIDYLVFAPDTPAQQASCFQKKIRRIPAFNFLLYPELRISVPNYYSIKRQLNQFKPDLLHLITPFNLGLNGFKYARDHQLPFVASYHTNFSQFLAYYNLKFLENPSWHFFRWFHNQAEQNYCPSQSTLEELTAQGINNLKIWGRGINPKLFSPEKRSCAWRKKYGLEDKTTVLYVGRLAPEKNIKLLIDSIKQLNKNYYDQTIFLLTGDGPSYQELRQQSPDNVIFTGYLTGETLSAIYASADIFAFPSVTETYGNVILEAMASGLPVVAFRAGGVKENLRDHYNGLACPENDLGEFRTKLEELITNPKLRHQLSKNARQYSLNRSWEHVFSALINSYQEVLSQREQASSRSQYSISV